MVLRKLNDEIRKKIMLFVRFFKENSAFLGKLADRKSYYMPQHDFD